MLDSFVPPTERQLITSRMPPSDFRTRIYERYNSTAHGRTAPDTASLASRAPYLRRVVRRHFPPDRDARVLDVGCGYGALLHFAREAGYRNLAGVDGSPEQVSAAAALGIEGVRRGDLLETLAATPDESQDVVIAFDLIEHLTRDELLRVVDDVRRVLRRGGRWLVHTPNGESPFVGRIRYGDLTHEQAFTRNSLSQLLLSSGFARVEFHEDVPVVHGAASALRYVVWRVIRAGLRVYVAAETGSTERDAVFTQNLLAVAWK
jgi:2-polyprenyl-3-methyl-5-hydroxy-6-metoxy-1,4-benzoquinol methylase